MPANQPQVQAIAGGEILPGIVSVELESVGYFAAGRFSLVCAVGSSSVWDAAQYLALGSTRTTISIGTVFGATVELFTGQIDNIRCDLLGGTATLTGRDLSCLLIDSEIAETFANQTSSQVADAIAARHQLGTNVTPTSTPVGQYYDLDHARTALGVNSRSGTEWNLLCWLAMIEGFTLSVTGTTLNFGSTALVSSLSLTPNDCVELSLDLSTALPVVTSIKSWNTRSKTVVQQSAGSGPGVGTTLIRPNLTARQASGYALRHMAILKRQARMISLLMPGELTLQPGSTIQLSQTNSSFDGDFAIDSIRRSVDPRRGFTQSIRAYAIS